MAIHVTAAARKLHAEFRWTVEDILEQDLMAGTWQWRGLRSPTFLVPDNAGPKVRTWDKVNVVI